MRTVKTATLALVVPATVAAAIALPATARADNRPFQSPMGNILCLLGGSGVACDVSDYTYQVPPGPPCAQHIAWGNRFSLQQGKPAEMVCHGDTLRVPGEQTLDYGQTISAGTITCDSEPSGVTCTDSSSGHYFQVSRDSYALGGLVVRTALTGYVRRRAVTWSKTGEALGIIRRSAWERFSEER